MPNFLKNFENEVGISKYSIKKTKIGGRIKIKPEDFIVTELDLEGIPVSQKNYFSVKKPRPGLFTHFILKKRLVDTPSAINRLAKNLSLSQSDFGYAGLKDALAITYQRVSLWGVDVERLRDLNFRNMEILNPTPASYHIRLGELSGNQFQIRVSYLEEKIRNETIHEIVSELKKYGFPNYFGLQRFGSKRPVLHLMGKHIIKRNYKKAVYTYLSTISPAEQTSIRLIREKFLRDEDYTIFIKNFPRHYTIERKIAEHLKKRANDFQGAILRLPSKIKLLFISAYQSYLFNRTLNQIIDLRTNLDLPLLGFETIIQSYPKVVQSILNEIIKTEKISLESFKNPIKEFSTRGGKRSAFVVPKELNWVRESKNSIILNFKLPKGTYATALLREIIDETRAPVI
ncbi:MAG: tRNA pseudouridine(13) synthase TruD [Promethearchaeota archaeon]